MIWACGSSASLFEELMELEELDDELLEELNKQIAAGDAQ